MCLALHWAWTLFVKTIYPSEQKDICCYQPHRGLFFRLAAKCMAHFHSTKLNFETHGNGNITNITKPAVYKMIKKFMDAMPDKFPDPYKQLKY